MTRARTAVRTPRNTAAPTPDPRTPGTAGTPAPRTRRAAHRTAALLLAPLLTVAPLAGTAHAEGEGIQKQEWALGAIQAKDAWKTTKGKGITVAVLDTGVDESHPDLKRNTAPGKDFVRMGAEKGDRTWARHGTAMAGIVAGHGHGKDDKLGVMGIAPEARILPVRVLLEESDPQRKKARDARGGALADGIRYAADHGADVINLSLGDDSSSAHPEPREDAAVRYALSKGSLVVASSGNGGEDGDHISYPAAYPGVLAVAAVDKYGARAAFSTRRWYATLAAPGKDVVIADPDRKYYEGWGTSAAAAVVSGAAALVRAAHPDLSPAQVKKLLAETARNTPEGGRSDALGTGVVDPAAAIEVGSTVKPRAQAPARVAYPHEYFGSGPVNGQAAWAAVVAAVVGSLLIAAAVALHRTRRD